MVLYFTFYCNYLFMLLLHEIMYKGGFNAWGILYEWTDSGASLIGFRFHSLGTEPWKNIFYLFVLYLHITINLIDNLQTLKYTEITQNVTSYSWYYNWNYFR